MLFFNGAKVMKLKYILKTQYICIYNQNTMIFNFLNIVKKLQRKQQISLLKKHPQVYLESIKLGIDNHFTLYPNLKKITIGKQVNFRNYIHIIVGKNAVLEIGNHIFMNNFCSRLPSYCPM